MRPSPIAVRQAGREDLAHIHRLVHELAVYENAPEEFVATLEDYQRDFAAGAFQALVAETPQEDVIAMALYYLGYSTWKGRMLFLEDFVVQEAFRRQGVGQQLFDAVLEQARVLECRLVKWQVLDWNEPALSFYRRYGAAIESNWWNGKIFFETS
jgi:GNAT superfamily N-acetyltransferase